MPFFVGLGFKFLSLLILILINLYLLLSKNKEKINNPSYLLSGFGFPKNREKLALVIGFLLGNMGNLINIKNEIKEQKMNTLNNQALAKVREIREGNEQLAEVKQKITDELTTLAALKSKSGKYNEYIQLLNQINADLSTNISKFNNVSLSDEAVVSYLLVICDGLKENIGKFSNAQSFLEVLLNNTASTSNLDPDLKVTKSEDARNLLQESNSDYYKIEWIDNIHKSSFIIFDSFDS
jgi:hypothetical protein